MARWCVSVCRMKDGHLSRGKSKNVDERGASCWVCGLWRDGSLKRPSPRKEDIFFCVRQERWKKKQVAMKINFRDFFDKWWGRTLKHFNRKTSTFLGQLKTISSSQVNEGKWDEFEFLGMKRFGVAAAGVVVGD